MPALPPNELLARHLEEATKVARHHIIQGKHLPQRTRQNLLSRGCLFEIVKGWYALVPPGTRTGDTALWHGHFWNFLALYLNDRFGDDYCLSAEASIDLWAGSTTTPKQMIIMIKAGGAGVTELAHGTSLVTYRDSDRFPEEKAKIQNLYVMARGMALARTSASHYQNDPISTQLVLKEASGAELAKEILRYGKTASANRIVGALLAMEENAKAREIIAALEVAKFPVKPENPFQAPALITGATVVRSPYAGRIQAMWAQMRDQVIESFPPPPKPIGSPQDYLAQVEEIYNHDAFNSLSIEGYRVTPDLIERVRTGRFDEQNELDKKQIDALAALGYRKAFKAVEASLASILNGEAPGQVAERDLQGWYQALFSPAVEAGFVPTHALAGYRDRRVFITNSMHVPPPKEAVTDAMEALFALLKEERHPGVRAVLGHFAFVFIHPYSDGNGRIARFLMNAMMAGDGYPWTIIRLERRTEYMAALEEASVRNNVGPFSKFVAEEMQVDWSKVPKRT